MSCSLSPLAASITGLDGSAYIEGGGTSLQEVSGVHLAVTILGLAVAAFSSSVSSDGDAVLSYACGGGITGGAYGAAIHREGRISRWTIERAGASRDERALEPNPEGVAKLFALLDEVEFESIEFNHPHYNWRCSLTLTKDGEDHTVSWGHGRFPLPAAIQRIVDGVEKLVAIPGE